MVWKSVMLSVACMLLATPAFSGVTQAQRDACERAANHVSPPFMDAREKEAWIANCLADATAGSPPKTGRY